MPAYDAVQDAFAMTRRDPARTVMRALARTGRGEERAWAKPRVSERAPGARGTGEA